MADDIVERLRTTDEWADQTLLSDAADEIERLRTEIQQAHQISNYWEKQARQ